MSVEYGIFNDEGCIEAGMWSEKEAQAELAKHYIAGESNLLVDEICRDHDEQARGTCEQCNGWECTHEDADDDDRCLDCGEITE